MLWFNAWYILPAAFILDIIVGDPQTRFHPIRGMGKAILIAEPLFRRLPFKPVLSGFVFSLSLIVSTWVVFFLLLKFCFLLHPVIGVCAEIIIIYYCISMGELKKDALDVGASLENNDLVSARQKLSLIVGRDVSTLSETGVARASVETVAENFVDGVMSPLFFAMIGGAPLAMAFKMVSTLDSMVGYKNKAYIDFGKASARIDDIANFIPARLSVPIISVAAKILGANWGRVIVTAVEEGQNHSSPNAGYPEAAFAGALGVKLGGPNYYHGELVEKPYIGSEYGVVEIRHIKEAGKLISTASVLWVSISSVILLLIFMTG